MSVKRGLTTLQTLKAGALGLAGGVAALGAVVETLTLLVDYFTNRGDDHETDRKMYKKRRKARKRVKRS